MLVYLKAKGCRMIKLRIGIAGLRRRYRILKKFIPIIRELFKALLKTFRHKHPKVAWHRGVYFLVRCPGCQNRMFVWGYHVVVSALIISVSTYCFDSKLVSISYVSFDQNFNVFFGLIW